LIDQCGLRGFRIGTAEVSVKHANFIQADPGGRASDVVAVMDHVQVVVQQKFGFNLRSEVRLIGWTHEINTRGSDE
jgi:UDP-N-acetylmuramate dehydrogenase